MAPVIEINGARYELCGPDVDGHYSLRLWNGDGTGYYSIRPSPVPADTIQEIKLPPSFAELSGKGIIIVDSSGNLETQKPDVHIAAASEAHALSTVFLDTEVEAALNALGVKINAILVELRNKYILQKTNIVIIPSPVTQVFKTSWPGPIIPEPAKTILSANNLIINNKATFVAKTINPTVKIADTPTAIGFVMKTIDPTVVIA